MRRLLVEGEVDPASRTPASLWSNRLVLPGVSVVAHLNLDSKEKLAFLSETVSLRGRNLDGAVLIDAILPKADFTGASLKSARLDEANLHDAKLECADWVGDEGHGKTPICAQLQGAVLEGALLQGAVLEGASLRSASLVRAELQSARLVGTQLQGARLVGAQLQGASLDWAKLQGANLDWASLQGALLSHASLQGAWLVGAQLQGAVLDEASLQGASLDGALLQGAELDGASLQGAELDGASLQGASLLGAELQGASLLGAELQGARLDGASVWRANGSEADVTNASIANLNPAPCKDLAASLAARLSGHRSRAKTDCPWTHEDFVRWQAGLADQVPAGVNRDDMLHRIQSLDPDHDMTPDEQDAAIKWEHWQAQTVTPDQAEGERANQLGTAGCQADSPAVITALIARMSGDVRSPLFPPGSRNRATLARAFLAPDCGGARGLSPDQTTTLQRFAAATAPAR